MPHHLRSIVAIGLALLLSFVASLAAAQDEAKGRELAGEAMGHYNAGEFEAALESFRKAEAVYPAAQVLRMKGYTLMALENWPEAADAIEAALETNYKPLAPKDAEHAQDQLKKVLEHLAVVEMRSNAPSATVAIDGQAPRALPATIRLLPGAHRFVVEAPDHETLEQQKTFSVGEHDLGFDMKTLDPDAPQPQPLTKPEPEPKPDEPSRSFGWFGGQGPLGLTAMGIGAAVGGVGLGLALYGTSLRSAVRENIDAHNASYGPGCEREPQLCAYDIELINRDGRRARDLQNTGMVMGIAGGGLLVVGTILFLFSDDSPLADDEADTARLPRCGGGTDGVSFGLSCHGAF
jgi:hypothetical protein